MMIVFMPIKKQQIAVKAFILKRGQLLLVNDNSLGKWDLPGGRIKFSESPAAALKREVQEELGVKIKNHSKLPVMAYSFIAINGVQIIALGYDVNLASEQIKLNKENNEWGYFNLREIKKMQLCSHGQFIIKYLKEQYENRHRRQKFN